MKLTVSFFSLALVVLLCRPVAAAYLLEPAILPPGGVATLCWQGTETPTRAAVSGGAAVTPFFRRDQASCALLAVDLDAPAGDRSVTIAFADAVGKEQTTTLTLQVTAVEKPEQRLSLPPQMVTPTKPQIVKRIAAERKVLDRIFTRRTPIRFDPVFIRPVDGEVISAFGLRRVLNGVPKSPHNGLDLRAQLGTPVACMASGEVVLAGDLYYTGKTVVVDHGGGLFSLYAHLDTLAVASGKRIVAGEKLGTVGSTGRSTGPHLHFGTRIGTARVDPLALLAIFKS